MQVRPPIITILGHVDHGKTTLLDSIRHTNVTASESGGITQHIGAYQVKYQENLLTFIDTPGHAAFSAMRSRGGRIADIAILVVAADDGVMPQTKESIQHISAAKIPFVVAITKSDIPGIQTDKVKGQLAENDVFVEGYGGNIPVVEVSAKTGVNLDKLLETLILMSQLEEITADEAGVLEAIVIESNLDRLKGPIATIIVKNGTLKAGDHIAAITNLTKPEDNIEGKVRSMADWQGTVLKEALPSTPVQILGFTKAPPVGSIVTNFSTVDKITNDPLLVQSVQSKTTSKDSFKVLIKADVGGTLEAILGSLPPEVEVRGADTGPINESDILLAETTKSTIIGFRTKAMPSAQRLAEIDHIDIFTYQTIYDLLEALPELIKTAKERAYYELELAKVHVLKILDIGGLQIIGANVTSGSISVNDQVRLEKNGTVVAEAKVTSLRIGRKTESKIKKGEEFGLITEPLLQASAGDTIIAFKIMSRDQD